MWWKDTFLDSNFFVGLITLIVGGFAIFTYVKQKEDKKRESARLILQEIRYAEQQIRIFRTSNQYSLYTRLLPTNSWDDNIHLFVKELKENEIDMISAFYARAKYIDFLILKRSEQKIDPHPQQTPTTPIVLPQPSQTAQIQNDPQVLNFVLPVPSAELVTIELLRQVSYSVEFIYNTPVVEKLREISTKKWHEIV